LPDPHVLVVLTGWGPNSRMIAWVRHLVPRHGWLQVRVSTGFGFHRFYPQVPVPIPVGNLSAGYPYLWVWVVGWVWVWVLKLVGTHLYLKSWDSLEIVIFTFKSVIF
jgi:hypothetical protein